MLTSMPANIPSYENNFPKPKVDVLKDEFLQRVLVVAETGKEVKFDTESPVSWIFPDI